MCGGGSLRKLVIHFHTKINRHLVSVFFCVTDMASEVTSMTFRWGVGIQIHKSMRNKTKQTVQLGTSLSQKGSGDILEMGTMACSQSTAQHSG